MSLTENFQHHIDITRRQIIGQLEQEIALLEDEMGKLSAHSGRISNLWDQRICSNVIQRKRRLIECLE